ncbi:hypothetical protein OAU97_00255, partial [bacterium]|nr:hypothetical protein [bacterium]
CVCLLLDGNYGAQMSLQYTCTKGQHYPIGGECVTDMDSGELRLSLSIREDWMLGNYFLL